MVYVSLTDDENIDDQAQDDPSASVAGAGGSQTTIDDTASSPLVPVGNISGEPRFVKMERTQKDARGMKWFFSSAQKLLNLPLDVANRVAHEVCTELGVSFVPFTEQQLKTVKEEPVETSTFPRQAAVPPLVGRHKQCHQKNLFRREACLFPWMRLRVRSRSMSSRLCSVRPGAAHR